MFWIILVVVILFLVEVKLQLNDKTYLKNHISFIFKKQKGENNEC